MLEVRELSKDFGKGPVVDRVGFSVERGTSLAVIGPSGCGKTTLLRLISGLDIPCNGDVLFDGIRIEQLPVGKRKVHLVFQSPLLYPFLSVRGNLTFPEARGSKLLSQDVEEICRKLEILDLLERRPNQISGGEAQRVALARVLIRRADIVLLDEPLSEVDPLRTMIIREFLLERLKLARCAILYVTHDLGEAAVAGDRIAIMRSGKIHQIGTARELYTSPKTEFVAEYVGGGRLASFDATVMEDAEKGQALFASDGITRIPVPIGRHLPVNNGARIRVLFRGGQLKPVAPQELSASIIEGQLQRIDIGFERTTCLFKCMGGEIWRIELPPNHSWANGVPATSQHRPVFLDLEAANLLFFDTSGVALFDAKG
jgi:ABC-type sugar transport system ATPase subunit